ncbi:TonB family protein [Natronocella acetinitrilica]|uniref:TonB family protein n=1 Tax=Natronocella acetinitrilica TaxID=414046 RepID=A0AAE3G2H1_9GAMM|nr:TonB family protein [Natronocella acetinitrilica]MCP1674535.1 TonB family protein [Natronocella acetinitrilica]
MGHDKTITNTPGGPRFGVRAAIALAALLLAPGSAAAADSRWVVERTTDLMDDTEVVAARIQAREAMGPTADWVRPMLWVSCGAYSNVQIRYPQFIGEPRTNVRIRLDDEPAVAWSSYGARDGRGATIGPEEELLRGLARAERVRVEISTPLGRYVSEFTLAGSAVAIAEVVEACNLEEHWAREAAGTPDADVAALRARYVSLWAERVRNAWTRPPGDITGLSSDVRVNVMPTGSVVSVEVVGGSGDAAFDRSVEQAIRRASPLPVPEDRAEFDRSGLARTTFRFNPDG